MTALTTRPRREEGRRQAQIAKHSVVVHTIRMHHQRRRRIPCTPTRSIMLPRTSPARQRLLAVMMEAFLLVPVCCCLIRPNASAEFTATSKLLQTAPFIFRTHHAVLAVGLMEWRYQLITGSPGPISPYPEVPVASILRLE